MAAAAAHYDRAGLVLFKLLQAGGEPTQRNVHGIQDVAVLVLIVLAHVEHHRILVIDELGGLQGVGGMHTSQATQHFGAGQQRQYDHQRSHQLPVVSGKRQ